MTIGKGLYTTFVSLKIAMTLKYEALLSTSQKWEFGGYYQK